MQAHADHWADHSFALFSCRLSACSIPTLPGFIRNINPKLGIPVGSSYVFCVVYPVGCVVAGSTYYALSLAFPPTAISPLSGQKSIIDSYNPSIDGSSMEKDDKVIAAHANVREVQEV